MSTLHALAGGQRFPIQLAEQRVIIDDKPVEASLRRLSNGLHLLTIGDHSYDVFIEKHSDISFDIWIKHFVIPVTLEDRRSQLISHARGASTTVATTTMVRAPMPGLVRAVEVSVGDLVEPGKGLVVLEAMKMENEIRSSVHGRVKEIKVSHGMAVEKNQQLLVIEPNI